jgi:hypothetical protein
MKRHEMWRYRYRMSRDLDHLNDDELSERLHDALNNIRTRTQKGKVGVLLPTDRVGEAWHSIFTEVLEECSLRGYPYPGPINISKYRSVLDHAFDPIPDMDRLIERHDLNRRPYVMKFGELRWLTQAIEHGTFRIASARYYDQQIHNHARRDCELKRHIRLNPRNPQHVASPAGWSTVSAHSDYYLYSLTETYSARLFGDFAADACLVIFDPRNFLSRLRRAVSRQLPGWQIQVSRVNYYDPVRVDVGEIVVPTYKPFRHAYQKELRLICIPPTPDHSLDPIYVELGPLDNCATLADLTTHPPAKLPHDPLDDPLQSYGNTRTEDHTVNHLPTAAKVQGILLNKAAPRHEDWTFQVQYTDADGNWHEMKMPMLDGLYLLNLLRAAEQEQHLGIWNRPSDLGPPGF